MSCNMITFDAALPTSKLEAVEPDSGPTCCAIETSACAQMRTNIPLGLLALPESHRKGADHRALTACTHVHAGW